MGGGCWRARRDAAKCHPVLSRAGSTLIELLVALVMAAIVLGAATSSLLRQQRATSRIHASASGDGQLRSVGTLLPNELRQLAAGSGDLVAGEARDTALQLRAVVASGLSCDDAVGEVRLIPATSGALPVSGIASAPRRGDSLWWLGDSASWRGRRIGTVSTVTVRCTLPVAGAGVSTTLALDGGDTIRAGTPVRVTRHARYALYRSGDGSWQLGMREWVESSARFATPQPVAGPFLPRDGARLTGFRYFDSFGTELVLGVEGAPADRVRRIRTMTLSAVPGARDQEPAVLVDSVDAALANGRDP